MKRGGKFPDRWLKYDPLGKELTGTRFVPFKCPLDKNYFISRPELDPQDVFTVDALMDMADKVKKRIGIVFDLTNTDRYYDPTEFTSRGIKYVKIHCPGHEVDGREDIVHYFCSQVREYLKTAEPDMLIGVHCTHGLNRTGYLIGRYLLQFENWSVDDFLKDFAYSRGHPLEREAYAKKLRWAEQRRIELAHKFSAHKG